MNPVDQRFCGACGIDLEDAVHEKLQSLHVAVQDIDRLAEMGRFVDAIEKLRGLTIPDHSQLAHVASEILRRLAAYPKQRDATVAEARRAHDDAEQFVVARDYRRASDRLSRILPAFQTAEMRELQQRVEAALTELKRLTAEVQQAVANKAYDGLLGKVERLVQLEPPNEKLDKLLDQLRARQSKVDDAQAMRAVETAQAALQANKYSSAQAALEQFPPSVRDEELLRQKREADERVWLAAQVRNSPRLSPVLVEIGKRLKELQPHDPRAAELHQELARRWKRAVDEQGQSPRDPPAWAKPPAPTALGVPVDFIPVPKELLDHPVPAGSSPREFLVAFGLALQGIGRADVGFNLRPREEGSWLDKVSRLKLPKSFTAAWGLDFGTASLKAVRLTITRTDKRSSPAIRVDEALQIPLDNLPADESDRAEKPLAPEAAAFEQLRTEKDLQEACLVVSLPGVQTLVRSFKVPPAKPERLAEAIHYEVRGSVPLGEHELVYGTHQGPAEVANGNGSGGLIPVIAVAASRTHVEERIGWLGDLASSSVVVQSTCVALVNALRFGHAHAERGGPTQPYAVIDLGAETLSVVVDEGDLFWFRSSYDGMKLLDDALAKELQLTRQQAAQLRRRPTAARQMHRVDRILQPGFERLQQAIFRGLERYGRERNRSVERVFLCGGGANQFGLLRNLWFGE